MATRKISRTRTRTRTITHPYDTEANAPSRGVRALAALESNHKEVGRQVRRAQAPGGVGIVIGSVSFLFVALPRGGGERGAA